MSGSLLGRRCARRLRRKSICPLGNDSEPSQKRKRQSYAVLSTPKVNRRKKNAKHSLAKKSVTTAKRKTCIQNNKIGDSSSSFTELDILTSTSSTPLLDSNRLRRSRRLSNTNKLPEGSKCLTRSSLLSALPPPVSQVVKTKIKSKLHLPGSGISPKRSCQTRSLAKVTGRITRSGYKSILVDPIVQLRKSDKEACSKAGGNIKIAEKNHAEKASSATKACSKVAKKDVTEEGKFVVSNENKEVNVSHKYVTRSSSDSNLSATLSKVSSEKSIKDRGKIKSAAKSRQKQPLDRCTLSTNSSSASSRQVEKDFGEQDEITISNAENQRNDASHKQTESNCKSRSKFENCETSKPKYTAITTASKYASKTALRYPMKNISIDDISSLPFSPAREKHTKLSKYIYLPPSGISVRRKKLLGMNLDTLGSGENRITRRHTIPVIVKGVKAISEKNISNCRPKNCEMSSNECTPKNILRSNPKSLTIDRVQQDCLITDWNQARPKARKGAKPKKSVQSTPRIKKKSINKQKGKNFKSTLNRESDDSGTFSGSSAFSTPDYSKLPVDDLVTMVDSLPRSFKKGLNKKSSKCLSTPIAPKRKATSMPAVSKPPNMLTKSSLKEMKKKTSLPAGSLSSVPKGKGTLKRKRWMLNALREKNDGYEDDLFECQKFDYLTKAMKNFDDESDSSISITTPKFGCILSPMLPKKTPRYKDCISPSDLLFARKNAEEYLFRRNKKRKTGSPAEKDQGTSSQTSTENDASIPEKKKLEFADAMNVLAAFRKSVVDDGDSDDDDYFSDVSV